MFKGWYAFYVGGIGTTGGGKVYKGVERRKTGCRRAFSETGLASWQGWMKGPLTPLRLCGGD